MIQLRQRRGGPSDGERGQGLIEFAMLVPVFMLLLLGMLEFGFVFDHTMTINYATREGARSGAAFAAGNDTTMVCNTLNGGIDVDKQIVAAVQRVLVAPGSLVDLSRVSEILIYSADSAGAQIGTKVNVWSYAVVAGVPQGPLVDGSKLSFNVTSTGWNACNRDNTWTNNVAPESIGVRIQYTYAFVTPLASIFRFFGPPGTGTLPISDRTVMALNPTD